MNPPSPDTPQPQATDRFRPRLAAWGPILRLADLPPPPATLRTRAARLIAAVVVSAAVLTVTLMTLAHLAAQLTPTPIPTPPQPPQGGEVLPAA